MVKNLVNDEIKCVIAQAIRCMHNEVECVMIAYAIRCSCNEICVFDVVSF